MSEKTFEPGISATPADEYEGVIIRGEAKEIGLAEIEKGITALWQAATKTKKDQEGEINPEAQTPVARACVLNLVIFTESDAGLDQASETAARLTWSYPCRAIVLVARPDRPTDEMMASISAHCQLPDPKGNKVCCEQITIEGSGHSVERLASMVLPLLVADLPVVLWWPGDPTLEGPSFERLMATSDRLIVDSRRFVDPARSFARLAALSEMRYRETAFNDLNWARLTPWRRIIAQFFDPLLMMPYLQHIDKITIEYEAPDDRTLPNFSEALLLIGWMGNQLDWQAAFTVQKEGVNASLIVNAGGKPLSIQFSGHNDRQDELGGITSVKIEASIPAENRSAIFTIALKEDYEHAEVITLERDKPVRSRMVSLEKRDETDLLGEDLAIIKRDRIYEKSLALASKLVG